MIVGVLMGHDKWAFANRQAALVRALPDVTFVPFAPGVECDVVLAYSMGGFYHVPENLRRKTALRLAGIRDFFAGV